MRKICKIRFKGGVDYAFGRRRLLRLFLPEDGGVEYSKGRHYWAARQGQALGPLGGGGREMLRRALGSEECGRLGTISAAAFPGLIANLLRLDRRALRSCERGTGTAAGSLRQS